MTEAAESEETGAGAFELCELEWIRKRLQSRLACEGLATFVDEVADGAADADADLVQRVRAVVEDVEELVLSLGHRVAAMPRHGIHATADEVAAAAAAALEDGIADVERAMHAAGWTDVRVGWPALAALLGSGDAFRFWDVPVVRFLASFRGADLDGARALAVEADVAELSFAELSDRQIARLAAALRWRHEAG